MTQDAVYTPPPVTGYRKLTQAEVDLMNDIKEIGEEHIKPMIDRLKSTPGLDQRWVAEGNTDLQKGIMSLVRAVAQPTNF